MTTLVVLAAGLASRYGGDKQLEGVGPNGELLLEYALHDAWRAGCRRAVLVIREELRAALEAGLAPAWRERLAVILATQPLRHPATPAAAAPRRKPWGTAHALLAARPHVTGDALVCNADDFYGAAAVRALADALAGAGGHAVAGYPLAATLTPHGGVSRALCRTDGHGRLLGIEERTGIEATGALIRDDRGGVLPPDARVSMNLWAFRAAFFDELERAFVAFLDEHGAEPDAELRIPDVVNAFVARGGEVRMVPAAGEWFGMTFAADRERVRDELAAQVAAGHYPRALRPG